MKVSEMPYRRYDIETLREKCREITQQFAAAESALEQRDLFLSFEEQEKHFQTAATLASIRFSLNTDDEFYSAENDYYDEAGPIAEKISADFARLMVTSPCRAELERLLSPLLLRNMEIQLKAFDEAIVPLMQEENRLCTQYDKLIASARFDWDGEALNAPLLGKYEASPDRAVRARAYALHGEWLEAHGDEIDALFDRLVKLRTEMARKLGYENFVTLGYLRMGRNCYDKKDVAVFRQQVRDYVVPAVSAIKQEQAAALGADPMKIYDFDIALAQGSPRPQGSVQEIFAAGEEMYRGLSERTAAFFRAMRDSDAFDVISRPGKSSGGYCTEIPDYGQQFIFANFNGTVGDIDVLTHEFGHAFAGHLAQLIPIYSLRTGGMETCEIHSMSMEFFCYPYMRLFFGDKADDYRYTHLSSALSFLPYGVIVDYFQQQVYEKPEMTLAERRALWLALEKEYRPFYDNAGVPGFENGRRWQYQSHIFTVPFYYIDYCLAQTAAIQFLLLAQREPEEAWRRYLELASRGGTMTYRELMALSGLAIPFEAGSLAPVVQKATALLEELAPAPERRPPPPTSQEVTPP